MLSQIHGVRHGFFCPGESGGSSDNLSFKNGNREDVLSARRRACCMLNVRYDHLTHVYQVHGTRILTIRRTHRGAGALTGQDQAGIGDGMITGEAELPLAVLIADCLPLFFAGVDGRAAGLVHAGWRGTHSAIAVEAVKRFEEDLGIIPRNLLVWIGPGISAEKFHVGEEIWSSFLKNWGHCENCIFTEGYRIDLKELNFHQLVSAGVLKENIEVSSDCTYRDERFFSYRRDGAGKGHNLALIQRGDE